MSRLHTLRWGDGPTAVVMLHGVGGGADAWGDGVSGTGRAVGEAGFLAVAPDLPGYGASPAIAPYDMAGLAAAVLGLVDALRDEPGVRRCVVVGHSMGGMVAQEALAQAPRGRIDGLVLSGTSPAFGKPDGAWQQRFVAERLAPLDAGGGMAALAPGLAQGMASPHAPPERVARCAALMARVPEATYRQALQAIVGFDRRAQLAAIDGPVLCLAGADDRNAPPSVMQAMAERIRGAEFVSLDGVGHLANMEAPEPFHRALLDFLKRHFGS